jgi:iron complex transport system permease protein
VQGQVVIRSERLRVSFRIATGSLITLGIATAAAVALFLFGVGSGAFPLTPTDVLAALAGTGDQAHQFVVWSLRLPRLLVALEVGAALALSGAILQTMTRNPLVAPDIIGVNSGAAIAAVAIFVLGGSLELVAAAAFAGGLLAALLVYVLAWRSGLSRYRLVLVGIGVGAIGAAGIQFLLTRGEISDVQRATVWLTGSLYGTGWAEVALLSAALAVLLPLAFVVARRLSALQLGDDLAASLGLPLERSRLMLVVVAVGLAAINVAVAGPIAFVAFIAPHLARRISRGSGVGVFPAAAAIGALLLIAADLAARRLLDPTELPAGIFTILFGGPYFVWLLRRAGRIGSGI